MPLGTNTIVSLVDLKKEQFVKRQIWTFYFRCNETRLSRSVWCLVHISEVFVGSLRSFFIRFVRPSSVLINVKIKIRIRAIVRNANGDKIITLLKSFNRKKRPN